MPSGAYVIATFLEDYYAVFPAIFQVVKTYFASFECAALLILPDGVDGRFSDSNLTLYSFLKLSLNGLLIESSSGWNWLVMPPESQPSHNSSSQVYPSVLQISGHERRLGLTYLTGYKELQGIFSRCFSPIVPSNKLLSTNFLCVHNNIFSEHLILRYHSVIENNIRWYYKLWPSAALHHQYLLLFITCSTNSSFASLVFRI